MYMAKVIESIVHRFVCSKLSFYNYSVHMWSVLGSRLELRLYFEVGKHRERAGILVQNEVHGEKYSNKAVQTDNLRAVCLVVSLSLNGTTRQTAHKLRLTAALSRWAKLSVSCRVKVLAG